MSEAIAQSEFDLPRIEAEPFRVVLPDDRRFRIGLAVAALVHVMFLVGFNAQPPRFIGDPGGAPDAIGVDFVSEADLRSMSSASDRSPGRPEPQSEPARQTPPPNAEPPPQPQVQPQPEAPPAAAEAAPPPPPVEQAVKEPEAPQSRPEETLEPAPPVTLEDMVEVLRRRAEASRPVPQAKSEPKPEPPKPPTPQKPPTRVSRLDLSLPPSVLSGPSGSGGMGLDRPAGITRSGENDSFARGVISALRQNMPQLRETRGQVTVRITLDMNGNLVRTEVVRPSSVGDLDQSVVFSTRQASFPFPPRNARPVDLVFLVTYIYR